MLRTVVSIQYRLVTHRRTYDDSILYRCSSIASRGKTSFTVFTFCHIFTFLAFFFISGGFCCKNVSTNATQNGILMIFCIVCPVIFNRWVMQHGKIIIQEEEPLTISQS